MYPTRKTIFRLMILGQDYFHFTFLQDFHSTRCFLVYSAYILHVVCKEDLRVAVPRRANGLPAWVTCCPTAAADDDDA